MVITLPCCNEAQCGVRNNNSLQLAAMVQNFPVNMWGNTEVDKTEVDKTEVDKTEVDKTEVDETEVGQDKGELIHSQLNGLQ